MHSSWSQELSVPFSLKTRHWNIRLFQPTSDNIFHRYFSQPLQVLLPPHKIFRLSLIRPHFGHQKIIIWRLCQAIPEITSWRKFSMVLFVLLLQEHFLSTRNPLLPNNSRNSQLTLNRANRSRRKLTIHPRCSSSSESTSLFGMSLKGSFTWAMSSKSRTWSGRKWINLSQKQSREGCLLHEASPWNHSQIKDSLPTSFTYTGN